MITDIAAALYARLADILVDEEQPPLVDGKIVLGRQRALENSRPPRVIMIPTRSRFAAQGETATTVDDGAPSADLARALMTDAQIFEVWVWSAASPPNPDADFDATEKLYKLFLRAMHQVTHGAYVLGEGEWLDQRPDMTQLVKLGHVFAFQLSLETPVQDDALEYVQVGTTANETTNLEGEAP